MKILLLSLAVSSYLFSAPAFQKMREFKNADGELFKAKAQGNQYLNWIETEDGEILKYNTQTQNFEYAKIENKSLKASGARYEKSNSKRLRSLAHIPKLKNREIYELWQIRREEALKRKRGF